MSRIALSVSLVASLSSFAFAQRIEAPAPHFAQPPAASAPAADSQAVVVLRRELVRDALTLQRANNLAAFHAYQRRASFPSNTYKDASLNVWRDADGHFCAAATIIKASGADQLVERVADESNFIRLADVTDGPLMDWMLTSGLTQEELVAIQEPFMPVRQDTGTSRLVDARRRAAETARLVKRYRDVDQMIRAHAQQSLELAVDRLMQHPDLAVATFGPG